ncbi:hypothetical protein HAX54_041788 [Datura stramonium]|uniref:Uncharacterized protein n=1 Tax=Datura stramonium TaxID=4076 RepID=A0ABS8SLP1_DATST|nr:hypothetical protein [Datura stramonium]
MADPLLLSLAAIADYLAPASAPTSNESPEFIQSSMNANLICFPSGNNISNLMELTKKPLEQKNKNSRPSARVTGVVTAHHSTDGGVDGHHPDDGPSLAPSRFGAFSSRATEMHRPSRK